MTKSAKFVAAYDIEDDAERIRVSKVFEGVGFRVQKSVFECRLSRTSLGKLKERLEELQIKTGSVLIYRLSDTARRLAVGKAPGLSEDEPFAFVV